MQERADIQLIPANRVSFGQRVAMMNAIYADYYVPMRVTQELIALTDRCYDIDLTLSVVARTRWELVGIGLLAVRGDRAWVSGVGVMPAWRRRGIARTMMTRLIEAARRNGAHRITLEVIAQNTPAQNLYRALGFRINRELLTWQRPAGADPLPVPLARLSLTPPEELFEYFDGWHDQAPCWQRDAPTLRKMTGRLQGYRLDWKELPAAYCLISDLDDSVSLVDIGIRPDSDLLMPGRLLLQALAVKYMGEAISIMNVPTDDVLSRILAAMGFLVTVRQVEMILDLDPP
jgi:GNAT superfamily N-acetyltransferase